MENNDLTLHEQKVIILGRLIKESSLTLEEALVLLKDEEKEEPQTEPAPSTPWRLGTFGTPSWIGTNPVQYYHSNGLPITGTGTMQINSSGNVGIGTTTAGTITTTAAEATL